MMKHLNNMHHTLWRSLMFFAIMSFGVLFLLQTILFPRIYDTVKESEFEKTSSSICNYYKEGDLDKINDVAQSNSLVVIVFSQNDVDFVSKTSTPYTSSDLSFSSIKTYMGQFYEAILRVDSSILVRDDDLYETGAFIYGDKMIINNEVKYLYVNSPIASSDLAQNVSNMILVIAWLFAMIAAAIIAIIMANRYAKPISSLNKSVKVLAKGDLSVEFDSSKGVTEIRELGMSLNQARDDLNQINVLQKELIANVSHDLRTPLTLIKSYAEMIRDITGDNPEKREKNLNVIISETDRLTSLVNDLLHLSKITSNAEKMVFEPVNLSQLLKDYKPQFLPAINQNNITYEEDILDDVTINASRKELNQAIYNFVTNAFNYTKDYVKITLQEMDGYYYFEVADNGEGIKEEEIEKIWDRYYRSKENHVRQKVGSGLGLSIAKEILIRHGFEYGVYNDSGAHFYFKVKR